MSLKRQVAFCGVAAKTLVHAQRTCFGRGDDVSRKQAQCIFTGYRSKQWSRWELDNFINVLMRLIKKNNGNVFLLGVFDEEKGRAVFMRQAKKF